MVSAIAIFTLGGGLTAGVFGVQRSFNKKTETLTRQLRMITALEQAGEPDPAPVETS
jgi:hypothetical protein